MNKPLNYVQILASWKYSIINAYNYNHNYNHGQIIEGGDAEIPDRPWITKL